ncbi:MAG: hypothetical protein ACI9KE_001497 [Polyangiales bacterium]|jgi:hypothetical protein
MRILLCSCLLACSSTMELDAGAAGDSGTDSSTDSGSLDAEAGEDGGPDAGCVDWCPAESLPEALQEISVTSFHDGFIVLGGFDGDGNVEASVHFFHPSEGFRALPSLPDGRHHAGVVVHDDDLYLFGGMRDASFTPLSRSLVLRDGASEWVEVASMPTTRAAGVAASVDGVIVFVAGQGDGRGGAEQLDDARAVYIYEPDSDRWREAAAMPTPRDHAAAFVMSGELWVVGGRQLRLEPTLDVVEVYNVSRDEWRRGPSMPEPRGGHAAAVVGGRAYVGGGEERGGALRSVDSFDFERGEWTAGADMLSPRHGHGMAALGASLYAVGGADMPIFAAVDSMEVLFVGP